MYICSPLLLAACLTDLGVRIGYPIPFLLHIFIWNAFLLGLDVGTDDRLRELPTKYGNLEHKEVVNFGSFALIINQNRIRQASPTNYEWNERLF